MRNDYTREEKIAMTAAALGIGIPNGPPQRFKTRIFYPSVTKKETIVYETVYRPKFSVPSFIPTRIYISGWGSARKKAAQNLRTVTVCSYCGVEGTESQGPDGRSWHIDHIFPVAKGGSNDMNNLCKACHTCNVKKHTKLIRPLVGTLKADGNIERDAA